MGLATEGERPTWAVLLRLFNTGRLICYEMTWLEIVLSGLLLATAGGAVAAQRRYLALRRKHKTLQRLYDHAEQQLSTLWGSFANGADLHAKEDLVNK